MNKKKTVIFTVVLLLVLAVLWTAWGNLTFSTDFISVKGSEVPEQLEGFKAAHISDLHNYSWGKANSKLLAAIQGAAPDIIVITGDLIDRTRTDVDIALNFAREAVKIAPVYFVTGNHEAWLKEETAYSTLQEGLEEAGVTILKNSYVDIEHNGAAIRLMGVEDPDFSNIFDQTEENSAIVSGNLTEMMSEGQFDYTVLLSHRPELFSTYVDSGVNMAFCGHAHGGQVRIPFAGGIIAPNQGFFPKYDSGIYRSGNTNMIVSRGLGNSIVPIRINNRPQLVVAVFQ